MEDGNGPESCWRSLIVVVQFLALFISFSQTGIEDGVRIEQCETDGLVIQ